MKQILLLVLVLSMYSCKYDEPKAKYAYETNPKFSWGFVSYFGAYYNDYNNTNHVVSLSLFTDSLRLNAGKLEGLGQYLYIEDVFIPANKQILPPGTYVASEKGEAFTFYPGKQFQVDEYKINDGAFIYYFEKLKSFTAMKHIVRGTFDVAIADNKHVITCNFVLSDSSRIQGSFNAELPHFDLSNQRLLELPRRKLFGY